MGGKAKTLYSIDNGDLLMDLLTKDPNLTTAWDLTADGNWARINNGKIEFKLDFNVNALRAGEAYQDTFLYAIQLGNGTISYAKVTINLTGENDGPALSDTTDPVAVAEAGDASAQDLAEITGSFAVTDLDVGDELDASVVGSPVVLLGGNPFVLPAGASALTAAGAFSVTDTTSNGGAASIAYSYNPGAANLDFLRAGQNLTITYTVQVNDGTTDSATQDVTFTITGTNDGPVLSDTTDPVAVAEAGDASAQDLAEITGSFAVTDLDVGDELDASVVGSPVVLLGGNPFVLPAGASALTAAGAFSVTDTTSNGGAASIAYSYNPGAANLDFLRAGQNLTITYTVQVNDGTTDSATQDVTFTITGTNDGPVLSDTTDPVAVAEAGDASAQDLAEITGSFAVTDLDVGDELDASVVGSPVVLLGGNPFVLPAGASALTAAGAFSVTDTTSNGGAASIAYSYNPGAANLDFLRAGQNLTITYTVQVNDGTTDSATQDVTFTITGTNDGPVINSPNNGDPVALSVPENTATSVVVTDVNATDVDGDTVGYTLSGADAALFNINSSTGEVTFKISPNYEAPTDDGGNNVYNFTVVASDGSLSDSQDFDLTVTNVAEGPIVAAPYTGPDADPNDFDALLAGSTNSSSSGVNLTGTNQANILHGSNQIDTLSGLGGQDAIYGHDGGDTINGGDGADTLLYGQAGDDSIYGGAGADKIWGGSGNDIIYGMTNPETSPPPDGGDDIYGGSGADTIYGQAGNDVIIGGYGADTLSGGGGNDTFKYLSERDTGDVINNWVGADDTLDFSAIAGITESTATNTSNVIANSVTYQQDGENTVIWADTDGITTTVELQITLTGVTATTLAPGDFEL